MRIVLFIVTEFESANGICTFAVMNKLVEQGCNVFCITNKEYNMKEIYEKNKIMFFTVKPRLTYRIRSYLIHNAAIDKKMRIFLEGAGWLINKMKLALSYFSWPLISPLYLWRIYRLALQLCDKYKIECIVPIYTQIDTLIAAKKIKDKNPSITYIPYFLDSLSGGYGPRIFSKMQTIKRGLRWEKWLLSNADKIILMESSKQHYEKYSAQRDYYKRMVFLDIPLLQELPPINIDNNTVRERNITELFYIGTLPLKIRDPRKFIDIFMKTKNSSYRLTFIGSCSDLSLLEKYADKDKRIRIMPFVTHDKAIELMMQADILVNIGNNLPNMTPSKIFEYMSSGKPIISTCPIEDEPSRRYLDKYPLAFIIDEQNCDIIETAGKMEEFIECCKGRVCDFTSIRGIFHANTPEAFVEEITASGE